MKSKPVLCLFFAAVMAAGAAVMLAPVRSSRLVPSSITSRFGRQQPEKKDAGLREMVSQSFLRLPLRFEENVGQTDSQARFLARGPGYSLFLTPDKAVLSLRGRHEPENKSSLRLRELRREPMLASTQKESAPDAVSLQLVGANPSARPEGVDPLPGKTNYLIGNDPTQWRTSVTGYSKVKYRGIYPGVDLIYYGNPQQLEYDFVVAPGASPSEIAMKVAGGSGMHIDAAGNLIVAMGAQPVQLHKPVLYQQTPAGRREVIGNFRLRGENSVGFEVAVYDPRLPLVIDPVLSYSTYLGGSGFDDVIAVTLDGNNNIVVIGNTNSTNFPTASPFRGSNAAGEDVFVTELSADGSQLIFSTYLGGNGNDEAAGIAVDSSGNVTIGGDTDSTNFPVANAFQSTNKGNGLRDAFLTRLNSSGSALIFSTYIGGSGDEVASGVAIDPSGSAYIVGATNSNNFPAVNAFQKAISTSPDTFVARLSAAGNALIYSSYLGGNGDDEATGIAVDSSGNAYVAGRTNSNNFPRANAVQNAFGGGTCANSIGQLYTCYDTFVTKFNAGGNTLAYSTYIGGNADDFGSAIAIDSAGNAYITGSTDSGNFPTQNPIQGSVAGLTDAFVTKLGPGGNTLVYSTYIGGTISDNGDSIQVDGNGNAYVSGATGSSDFPTVNSFQPLNAQNSSTNAFVLKITADGSALAYSTYLGGSGFGGAGFDEAFSLVLDGNANVYVAGATSSGDFPVVNPFQQSYVAATCSNGQVLFPCPDGFISKIVLNPRLFPNGIVNGASFAANSAVAAGSIVSAFGTDLTTTSGSAGTIPLPFNLAGLTVRMNGFQTPFFFASGGQLNLQVPWELAGQAQATVQVTAAGANIAPVNINLAAAAPGIFTTNSSGSGQGAILNASDNSFAAPSGSIIGAATRPANRGDFITIYCTGLGPVSNRPNTGFAAGNNSITTTTPVVTIGGIQVAPSFFGLAPTFVGLYQINVQVPANAQTGNTVPVAISVNGAASNTVQIAVQ